MNVIELDQAMYRKLLGFESKEESKDLLIFLNVVQASKTENTVSSVLTFFSALARYLKVFKKKPTFPHLNFDLKIKQSKNLKPS